MPEVPALRRSVAILRHLAASNRPISAGALVRGLEIPRSSAYELLTVLEELGLVARAESGYVLGAGVHELGASYLRTNPLQRLAQPVVRQLAEETSATAQLAVIRGWETVYVLKEQSLKSVAVITATGVRMPSYLTATGRAILANLPKSEVLAMLQSETGFVTRTGKGPTSVKQLNALLAQTRRAGWAIEHGEVTPGISTIAAPVHDVLSRPIAAIGLSISEESYAQDAEPLIERVVDAAAEVTAKLR
ncbi:IclR family transcriptional regulator [Brevibacterium sp.]|uniref:IclR family transcriptional regulator n=1 Tax=Brevibacterium sp. TaxID=1701 RepID=UPI0028121AD6|nr:IclR family transcriptional regulator [Brevibacterium sp.]